MNMGTVLLIFSVIVAIVIGGIQIYLSWKGVQSSKRSTVAADPRGTAMRRQVAKARTKSKVPTSSRDEKEDGLWYTKQGGWIILVIFVVAALLLYFNGWFPEDCTISLSTSPFSCKFVPPNVTPTQTPSPSTATATLPFPSATPTVSTPTVTSTPVALSTVYTLPPTRQTIARTPNFWFYAPIYPSLKEPGLEEHSRSLSQRTLGQITIFNWSFHWCRSD